MARTRGCIYLRRMRPRLFQAGAMRKVAGPAFHVGLPRAPKRRAMRLAALLCLLGLGFQVAGVGHWSGGHEIVTPDEAAEHASHCHGDTSSCSGGGGAVADSALADARMLPGADEAAYCISRTGDSLYADADPNVPDEPPRKTSWLAFSHRT